MFSLYYLYGTELNRWYFYAVLNRNTRHIVLSTHTLPGKNYEGNCGCTFKCLFILFSSAIVSWIAVLILQSGDIELNPGPCSDTDSIISSRSSIDSSPMSIAGLSNHLSMVHYNVQSITNKIDILNAELREFDILAFSETWLNPTIKMTYFL